MQHTITKAAALVAALALMGMSCERREIVTPKHGSLRVFSVNHPVTIRTNDAKGAVAITAFNFDTGQDTLLHISPGGDANFTEVIPSEFWQCSGQGFGGPRPNGLAVNGCVAALTVSDDQGQFWTGKASNKLYVCTGGYSQLGDRKHCDSRSIEIGRNVEHDDPTQAVAVIEWNEKRFYHLRSQPISEPDYMRAWEGDQAQVLFTGFHTWEHNNNAHDPALATDVSGTWEEIPWTDDTRDRFAGGLHYVPGDLYSVDIGVCSEFIPWKWEDRDPDGALNDLLGSFTNNLGIGEVIVNGMADNPIRESVYTEDAVLWTDAMTELWQRPDSPEFHFRISSGNTRHMCFVQYIATNNRVQTGPDSWFRFDQAFLSAWLELFSIGDCKTKNARIQYCGEIVYDRATQTAEFRVDPSTAVAYMDNYSLFKPACRNQFRERFINEFPGQIAEPAAQALTESLGELMTTLPVVLGADIRRIEATPRGIYLVLAESADDPQYGKGRCIRTLTESPPPNERIMSEWAWPEVPATGIRRPL